MKNLGISNYKNNSLFKYWTPIVYVFVILFFIFIITCSFSYDYYYSRPTNEGMGLLTKIINHELENTSGMIQYYKFDKDSVTMSNLPIILNTAASLSDNMFDATLKTDSLYNGSVTTMIDSAKPKVGNACLKMDLVDRQYVELPSFKIPEKGMTFTLWFNIQDNGKLPNPGVMTLFDFSDYDANVFNYRITAYYNISTKKIVCVTAYSQNNKQSIQNTDFVINMNTWYHFAWSMSPDNGGNSTICINGLSNSVMASGFTYPSRDILQKPTPLTRNFIGKCGNPMITNSSITDFYFNGYIDQFLVYDSAYTIPQMLTLFNSFSILKKETFSNIREGIDEYIDGLTYTIYNGYMNDDVKFVDTATALVYVDNLTTGKTADLTSITTGTNSFIGAPHTGLHTYTVQWIGVFKPDKSGKWYFGTNSDDCSYLWLGSSAKQGYTTANALVKNSGLHGMKTVYSGSIQLTASVYYDIRIQFGENGGGHNMITYFRHESDPINVYRTNGKGYYFTKV